MCPCPTRCSQATPTSATPRQLPRWHARGQTRQLACAPCVCVVCVWMCPYVLVVHRLCVGNMRFCIARLVIFSIILCHLQGMAGQGYTRNALRHCRQHCSHKPRPRRGTAHPSSNGIAIFMTSRSLAPRAGLENKLDDLWVPFLPHPVLSLDARIGH